MTLIPLIIDSPASYCRGSSKPVSLLSLPLGPGTILDHLVGRLEKISHGEILVLTGQYVRECDLPLTSKQHTLPVRPVAFDGLSLELDRYENSDHLLVVDPRRWPVGDHDFSDCQILAETYRGATHVIAIGSSGESARERVECDGRGQVRRIQRHYAVKSYSEVGGSTIVHSVVPLRSVLGLRFETPLELRAGVSALGILSQDLPRRMDVLNLGTEDGFLAFTERTVARFCRQEITHGFDSRGPDVLVGRGCKIHRTARLVGPLIIQSGAILEEGSTIIGPSVVGVGSRIMRGATVIQSAIVGGADVLPGVVARQLVAGGECSSTTLVGAAPVDAPQLPGIPVTTVAGAATAAPWITGRPVRERWLHCGLKRIADVVFALSALVALAPLLAVVALLVKLDSRGPVLFAHRREGRKGREFPCWKFRTMVRDAHQKQRLLYKQSEVDGPQFKMRNDPRVTRVGRWLRSTNVDELPQLINVVWGHMSLVGPRPSPFRENQICIPWRRARLSVRPGITGLWQVCRDENRHNGDFHEWIFYDMTYVRHFSVFLDLKIMAATVLTLGGRWSFPLSWLLPRVAGGHSQQYSVAAG